MSYLSEIKEIIKKSSYGKKLRAQIKVNKLVDRYMLSQRDIECGEKNPAVMSELVQKQRLLWPERWNEQNDRITWLASSPLYKGKENIEDLRTVMLFYYFAYGFSPSEFLVYGLLEKTVQERKKYISDRESVRYAYQLNDIDAIQLFMDKNKLYEKLSQFYGRQAISIYSSNDYNTFLSFIQKTPIFVKKSALESCGRGIELVDTTNKSEVQLESLFDEYVKEGNVILEERIHQSEALSAINDSTVNTVRCFTLIINDEVLVPWCFGKLGRKGFFVDNAAAGGLLVGIDVDSGKMIHGSCCDEFGQRYETHPDNGLVLKNFQYPEWEKMKILCKEAAKQIPEARWIGWDTAHTDNGWVIVEGNSVTEVIGPQSTLQIGIKDSFEKLIKN